MPAPTAVEKLYTAIEESARLVGGRCSPEEVRPVLAAYQDTFADGGVVFSAQTGQRYAGELNYAFTLPAGIGDPYGHALAHGFLPGTDHPSGALLTDLGAGGPVTEHFADCLARGGLRKLYAHFPRDLRGVADLAEVPSMPPAVGENLDLFARHGMGPVAMVGINYEHRTVSLYFQFSPEGRLAPATIGSLLRETGLPPADERMLEFASRSFRANVTLGWASPRIGRLTFAPPPGPGLRLADVPAPADAYLDEFATTAPRSYGGERINLFAVKWQPDGQFIEVCSYYQLPAGYEPMRLMALHKEHG